MHQLFLQITNEGSKDSSESLENMSLDIDMLVEALNKEGVDISTLVREISVENSQNPNLVKCVFDNNFNSSSVIPQIAS